MEDGKKAATMSAEKQKALAAALAQIEKQFGKGSIMKMGDAEVEPVQVAVSYTHLTLPTSSERCRSRWSPYH